jgi:hypothetical protein
MFEKAEHAEALVLEAEPTAIPEYDMQGMEHEHRKYILEVRPAGQQPFRVETKARVAIIAHPVQGETVTVRYDPRTHKTELHIEGDPRYDLNLIRESRKQHEKARREALLSGAPDLEEERWAQHVGRAHDKPQWTVPAACPQCGARVDQAAASAAEHPKCQYCENPLPHERVR